MRRQATIVVFAVFAFVLAGCSSRPLPPYEKPMARTQFQTVRTTAYTHTESDHREHGRSTALGTSLRAGPINSAAADWSRWPAGTLFRIAETGELFEVDDYGWALSGTNTIDLYKSSRAAMNGWGVRRVTIENLRWGDPARSLAVLRPRAKFRHVKRMVEGFADHYPSPPTLVATATAQPIAPTQAAPNQTTAQPAAPAQTRRATLAPFYSVSTQSSRAPVR
jgi:3D (Asp-Asp-Asp) domain-containing protein